MPFAVTHMFAAWVCGIVYERIRNVKIPSPVFAALVFGGALPDFDFALQSITPMHRTITHSIVGSVLISLIAWSVVRSNVCARIGCSRDSAVPVAVSLSIGMMTHIILDMVSCQTGVALLWPLPYAFSIYGVTPKVVAGHFQSWAATLDSALAVLWIFYLWLRKQVKFSSQ